MIYPSIDKLLTIVDSKFELALISARRSVDMQLTGFKQMPDEKYTSEKNIGKALEELAEGQIIIEKEV